MKTNYGMSIEETLNELNDYLLEKSATQETRFIDQKMDKERIKGEKLRSRLISANQVSNDLEKDIADVKDQLGQLPYSNHRLPNAQNKQLKKKLSWLEKEYKKIEETRDGLCKDLKDHAVRMEELRGTRRLVNP